MTLKVLSEPAFTGREEELKELESFLNSASEGKGRTIFILGEAGSGKTRLTREFLNVAKKKGASILAGWCLSDASVPYFPFIEAFNAYFASIDDESLNLQQAGNQLGMKGASQIRDEEQAVTAWLTGPRPIEKPGRPTEFSPQVWKDQAFAFVAKTLHMTFRPNSNYSLNRGFAVGRLSLSSAPSLYCTHHKLREITCHSHSSKRRINRRR